MESCVVVLDIEFFTSQLFFFYENIENTFSILNVTLTLSVFSLSILFPLVYN